MRAGELKEATSCGGPRSSSLRFFEPVVQLFVVAGFGRRAATLRELLSTVSST
jgi:hypothetical protein